jgi:hypothetical protein
MKDEGKGSAGVSPVVFGVPPNTSPPGADSAHQHVNDLLWKTEGVCGETPRTTTVTVALLNHPPCYAQSNPVKVNQSDLVGQAGGQNRM